jgi:hypothetical protein
MPPERSHRAIPPLSALEFVASCPGMEDLAQLLHVKLQTIVIGEQLGRLGGADNVAPLVRRLLAHLSDGLGDDDLILLGVAIARKLSELQRQKRPGGR